MADQVTAADLLSILLCSAAFSVWTLLTTFTVSLAQAAFFFSLVLSGLVWGRLALVAAGLAACVPRTFPVAFLVGSLLLGFGLAAIRLLTPLDLKVLYTAQFILGTALYLAMHRSMTRWRSSEVEDWVGLAITVLGLGASTLWMRHLFPAWESSGEVAVFRPFFEYFFHTTHVTPLLLPGVPVANGSIQFAGVPLAFYHYASYTFPALLTSLGGLPAFEALSALWLPLGMFFVGLAAFWLGTLLFGLRAGFWCAVVLRLAPDPSLWTFGINFYSFHAFLEATPAMAYAIAAAAVAVCLLILAIRSRRLSLVALSLAVAISTVFFKANMLLAAAPLCGLLFLTAWRSFRTRRMLPAVAILALVGMAGLWSGSRLRSAPTIGFDRGLGTTFVEYLFAEQVPRESVLLRLKPHLLAHTPQAALGRLGFVLLLTFQGGLPLVLVALAAGWSDRHPARHAQAVLFLALGIYLYSALCLPPNQNGDPFELQHRSFVWVYLMAVIYTVGVLTRMWNRHAARGWRTGFLSAFLLLLVPLVAGKFIALPRLPPLSTGLVASAEFIRARSRPLDIVWDSQNDPSLVLAALSQRRSYVAVSLEDPFPGSGALRAIHRARVANTEHFKQANSFDQLRRWAAESKARWFLLHPGDVVRWPAEFADGPAFASAGYKVYDLARLDSVP